MTNSEHSAAERRGGRLALIGVIPLVLLFMAPLAWTILASFRPSNEIFKNLYPFSLHTVIPETWTLENYDAVLGGPFLLALANSILVAVVGVVLGLAVSAPAAFALASVPFRGKPIFFTAIVLSFLIPFEAIAIPLADSFRSFGLQNSYIALILPGIGNGLAIFLLRQFFLSVPTSLAEAARMDGVSWLGIFTRIYVPLSRSALVGAGIILFLFQWQAFLWPLLIAPSPDKRLAPVGLADFAQEVGVDYGQMFAACVLTVIIPLLLLILFQRQFTQSLSSSGLKE